MFIFPKLPSDTLVPLFQLKIINKMPANPIHNNNLQRLHNSKKICSHRLYGVAEGKNGELATQLPTI